MELNVVVVGVKPFHTVLLSKRGKKKKHTKKHTLVRFLVCFLGA